MYRFCLTLCFFLIPILMIHAQEPDSGWEIIERCVGEPTTPPDDWTFVGTLLSVGHDGIYGHNAEWDTRRILAFRPNDSQFAFISIEGWYWVTFQGRSYCTGSCSSTSRRIGQMTVHDLRASIPQSQTFDWSFHTHDFWKYPIGLRSIPVMHWLSPNEFLYVHDFDDYGSGVEESVIFNIETGNRETYPTPLNPDEFHFTSPDGLLTIQTMSETVSTEDTLVISQITQIIDTRTQEITASLSEGLRPVHYFSLNAWSPDSQFFLVYKEENRIISLYLIDRSGLSRGIVATIENNPLLNVLTIDWSSDGKYLVISDFVTGYYSDGASYSTYVLNLETDTVYDLCTNTRSRALFAPDSLKIAIQNTDTRQINILDLATWELYQVTDNPEAYLTGWQHE